MSERLTTDKVNLLPYDPSSIETDEGDILPAADYPDFFEQPEQNKTSIEGDFTGPAVNLGDRALALYSIMRFYNHNGSMRGAKKGNKLNTDGIKGMEYNDRSLEKGLESAMDVLIGGAYSSAEELDYLRRGLRMALNAAFRYCESDSPAERKARVESRKKTVDRAILASGQDVDEFRRARKDEEADKRNNKQ